MYYISEAEVSQNLKMAEAIDILEEVFKEYHDGKAIADARMRTILDGKILNSMPAIIYKFHLAGLKVYYASKTGARFVVLVFNTETNELIATIEADKLGQIRTGALTAMVSRRLIRERSPTVAIIGSGYQAETQLEGILTVFHPETITVYSRTPKNSESFARKMSSLFGVDIKVANNAREAVSNARIINTITSSSIPIFSANDLGLEYHVNLAGANLPFRREVSTDVLSNSEVIIVEHFDQAMKESSEITDYVSSNGATRITELKDFIGMTKDTAWKRSVFKSMGIGLEDLASAYIIMKNMGLYE